MAAYTPFGKASLEFEAKPRSLTSGDLLAFLRGLPLLEVPRVVVLDNARVHRSDAVRAALPELRGRGVHLRYLPPYSPTLNRIEGVLKQVKYQGLPARAYTTLEALLEAVEQGFREQAARVRAGTTARPRPSA